MFCFAKQEGWRFWLQSPLWHKSLSDVGQVMVASLSSALHVSNWHQDTGISYTGLSKFIYIQKRALKYHCLWLQVSERWQRSYMSALHRQLHQPKGKMRPGGRGSETSMLFGSLLHDQGTCSHVTSSPTQFSILHSFSLYPSLSIWLKTGYQLLSKQGLSLSVTQSPMPSLIPHATSFS